MPEEKAKARALVRVLLEVDVGEAWGGDCPISQVWRQATEEVVGALNNTFKAEPDGIRRLVMGANVRIAEPPKVEAIITSRPDR